MAELLNAILLVLAATAQFGLGWIVAGALGARDGTAGIQLIAAVVIAASAAVAQAILLGLVGLGTSQATLSILALAGWALARSTLMRRPYARERRERTAPWTRLVLLTLGGILVASTVWFLIHPLIGDDGNRYHLTLSAAWIANGSPGSLVPVGHNLPFEAYPLTHEVLVAWTEAVSRSMVPAALINPGLLALVGLSFVWCGVQLRSHSGVLVLATVALVTSPVLTTQLNLSANDLAAVAWVTACGALCLAAAERPRLFGVALLAAALAFGSKTTAAPLAAVFLLFTAWRWRSVLRASIPLLLTSAVCAGLIGLIWPIRNLLLHGSPLWPFTSTPWGDPTPPNIEIGGRLASDPGSALHRIDDYLQLLWGAGLLLAWGLLAGIVVRDVRVRVLSVFVLAALLAFVAAPLTAFPPGHYFDLLQAGTVRYLAPAIPPATLALALVADSPGLRRTLVCVLFTAAIIANLIGSADIGVPYFAPIKVVAAGAAAGLVGAAFVWLSEPSRILGGVAAGIAVFAAMLIASNGYTERAARTLGPPGIEWVTSNSRFQREEDSVLSQQTNWGILAGDSFDHELRLLPEIPNCETIDHEGSWIVVWRTSAPDLPALRDVRAEFIRSTQATLACLRDRKPSYSGEDMAIYAPETVPNRSG